MRLYYDAYICSDCGQSMNLSEGAAHCPYCGGRLYRARSGARKTVTVCTMAAKALLGAALPIMMAAAALDSAGLMLLAAAALGGAAWSRHNAAEEKRKLDLRRRKI